MVDEYERMSENEKLEFLANLANMYYELNMTQSDIAEKLFTTRFKVAKLLQEARDKNVVEITIKKPQRRFYEIEDLFKKHFNLKDVFILDNRMLSSEETIHSLGKIGAEYLDSIITEDSIIGILWGKTIYNVVKYLKPRKKLHITAVQPLGAAGKDDPLIDAPELIRKVANAYGGKYKYLHAPLYMDNDYARKALMQEPVINDTLFLANKADILLTGIGTTDAMFASTLWSNYLERKQQYDLDSLKAIGCIYARMYDHLGNEVDIDINRKVIGIDLSVVHHAKYAIGVAAGKYKAQAILGAIRGNYINVLITDDSTALKVLSLAGIQPD